jgi:hypothetical protein
MNFIIRYENNITTIYESNTSIIHISTITQLNITNSIYSIVYLYHGSSMRKRIPNHP